jgi:hypothetical protein
MSVAAKLRFVSRQQHVENTRHVFRALLRECTYLPDAASQKYIPRYIRWRFDNASESTAHLFRQIDAANTDASRRDEAAAVLDASLGKAYKGLSQLIRANEGEMKPLLRILRHTYGRNGPRRYELMRALVLPDADYVALPSDASQVPNPGSITTVAVPAALSPPPSVTSRNVVYSISPAYSRLAAISSTQVQKNIDTHRSRLISSISIPAKNAWGRSMPRVRVKNLVKKKYAKFLDAILPPLPEHEWKQLQALALGTEQFRGCKPRRKRPAGCPPILMGSDLEKLVHISDDFGEQRYLSGDEHISKADKILSLSGDDNDRGYWSTHDTWLDDDLAVDDSFDAVLEDELKVRPLNKHIGGKDRGHRVTLRFMRRLWMAVFKQCPMLEPDESAAGSARRWKVTWGGPLRVPAYVRRENGDPLDELFGIRPPAPTGKVPRLLVMSRRRKWVVPNGAS